MADVKMIRTTSDCIYQDVQNPNLNFIDIVDGQLLFTVDTREMFLDLKDENNTLQRLKINVGLSDWNGQSSAEVFNNYSGNSENTAQGQGAHAEGYNTHADGTGAHAEGYLCSAIGTGSSKGYNHAEGQCSCAFGYNDHAEGDHTASYQFGSHSEGSRTSAKGIYSHAEGYGDFRSGPNATDRRSSDDIVYTGAFGQASHSEGYYTTANADYSHAEGRGMFDYNNNAFRYRTGAFGQAAHSEGYCTTASGTASHAEGQGSVTETSYGSGVFVIKGKATGYYSHSEGYNCNAEGSQSHAEGYETVAAGNSAHAEGQATNAGSWCSHAEGYHTITGPNSQYQHAEGYYTTASGEAGHAEGFYTEATGNYSHSEGYYADATGVEAHAEGWYTTSSGTASHAEGCNTSATATAAHAEGGYFDISYIEDGTTKYINYPCFASGYGAHAEGCGARATGDESHAEGSGTATYDPTLQDFKWIYGMASGVASHSEGWQNNASGQGSHAEGYRTQASSTASHSEGYYTTATGYAAHAEGGNTSASGMYAHAEGEHCTAGYTGSHAGGYYTTTSTGYETVIGKNNKYGTDIFTYDQSSFAPEKIDITTVTTSSYIDPSDGSVVTGTTTDCGVTDFIAINPNLATTGPTYYHIEAYTVDMPWVTTSSSAVTVALYDENKAFLTHYQWGGGPTGTAQKYSTTQPFSITGGSAKYLRLCCNMSSSTYLNETTMKEDLSYKENPLFTIGNATSSSYSDRNYIFAVSDKTIDMNGDVLFKQSSTPNIDWQARTTTNHVQYKIGSVVIYNSCIYKCITDNADAAWTAAHWEQIGVTKSAFDNLEQRVYNLEHPST